MFGFTQAVRRARERVVGVELVDSLDPCIEGGFLRILCRVPAVAVAGDKLPMRGWRLAGLVAILGLWVPARKGRHGHACLSKNHCFLFRAQHVLALASAVPALSLDAGIRMDLDCDLAKEVALVFHGT
ncbi:hypothetical protein [Variovorax sp. dw_954]|uniref:hypothetical protein n=1 Tax=Variovorax sp. dw_954 TaxID=2720078 RepID=UPI001BD3B249|nr:hypothetical protein [Variovorax sp. dw_954]